MTIPPPPTQRDLELTLRALAPLRALHSPRCEGIENVPRRGGFLLAGNHTIYGVLDVPLMVAEIYEQRGRLPRGLGDHAHYSVPLWRDLLTRFGTVRGTRENCAELMEAGEPILVYPGGGREVMKRKHEEYKLIWKERVGFVRMAVAHGYPIVPFGAIGVDDAYDIHLDGDSAVMAPARAIAARLTGKPEMVPPIATGIGPLPRPERYYFGFGKPIRTAGAGDPEDAELLASIRDRVRNSVYAQIAELKGIRAADPDRYPPARVRKAFAKRLSSMREVLPERLRERRRSSAPDAPSPHPRPTSRGRSPSSPSTCTRIVTGRLERRMSPPGQPVRALSPQGSKRTTVGASRRRCSVSRSPKSMPTRPRSEGSTRSVTARCPSTTTGSLSPRAPPLYRRKYPLRKSRPGPTKPTGPTAVAWARQPSGTGPPPSWQDAICRPGRSG